jgi:crotonobetainyl-CoA:carnitine CoA-transferase CaiB-like acyl-CoA transferase
LVESLVNFMDFQAVRWLNEGEVPGQAGNDHPTVFPMGTYRTADGLLNLSAMGTWTAFCETVDAPWMATDPRFAEAGDRIAHRDELREALESVLAAATTAEWVERLTAAGYPAGPVLAVDEAFADPQVRHLDLVSVVTHAVDGDVGVLRYPVTLTDTPASVRGAAAVPGTDTTAVLAELGYGPDEIATLLEAGVVAGPAR